MRQSVRFTLPGLLGAAILATLLSIWAGRARAQEGASTLGVVAGKVLDSSSGEPVIDAGVEVVGTKQQTRTDVDGIYRFKLPPGTYDLRFFAAGYQAARVTGVKVEAGKAETANTALSPSAAGAGVEVVEVVAQANRAAEATQLVERKNADVVEDTISAEASPRRPIRMPARSSSASRRSRSGTTSTSTCAVSASATSSLLNGNRLPSPDPKARRAARPLSGAVHRLDRDHQVLRAGPSRRLRGGLVDINLKDFPEDFTANLGMSLARTPTRRSNASRTYDGWATRCLGFDNGLPSIFGDKSIGVPPAGARRVMLGAHSYTTCGRRSRPRRRPTSPRTCSIGNTWGPLGMNLAASWTTRLQDRARPGRAPVPEPRRSGEPGAPATDDFIYDFNVWETGIGAVLHRRLRHQPRQPRELPGLLHPQHREPRRARPGIHLAEPRPDLQHHPPRYLAEDLVFGQLQGDTTPTGSTSTGAPPSPARHRTCPTPGPRTTSTSRTTPPCLHSSRRHRRAAPASSSTSPST